MTTSQAERTCVQQVTSVAFITASPWRSLRSIWLSALCLYLNNKRKLLCPHKARFCMRVWNLSLKFILLHTDYITVALRLTSSVMNSFLRGVIKQHNALRLYILKEWKQTATTVQDIKSITVNIFKALRPSWDKFRWTSVTSDVFLLKVHAVKMLQLPCCTRRGTVWHLCSCDIIKTLIWQTTN